MIPDHFVRNLVEATPHRSQMAWGIGLRLEEKVISDEVSIRYEVKVISGKVMSGKFMLGEIHGGGCAPLPDGVGHRPPPRG